jgi:hypothetical protein
MDVVDWMFGITPIAVISNVGVTGPSGDSLYKLSLPEINGALNATEKS